MKHADEDRSKQLEHGLTRRTLLGGTSAAAAAAVLGQSARATPGAGSRPTLVQVFLRGAMDGLTTVVPYADGDLYVWRPTLAVPPPGAANGALDLDGFFGLAPAAAPLLTPYASGHLAIVHASGSSGPTRSHFDGFLRMEFGDPGLPAGTIRSGWITRYLQQTAPQATSPLRAISTSFLLPYTLAGATGALPIPDLGNFLFPGDAGTAARRAAVLDETYAPRRAPVGPAALDTLASIGILAGVGFPGYVPANGALYPPSPLGKRLRDSAAVIKADAGVEVITIDVDGWDLHAEMGPIAGSMALLLDDLAHALEAFYLDMLGNLDDYVLVCLSEFGRRVEENASRGTDHGHGTAMFVMGGGVNGGRVIAQWPGLRADQLDQGDLAITIDYRDVLGEVLERGFGVPNLGSIFPQHVFAFPGVMV